VACDAFKKGDYIEVLEERAKYPATSDWHQAGSEWVQPGELGLEGSRRACICSDSLVKSRRCTRPMMPAATGRLRCPESKGEYSLTNGRCQGGTSPLALDLTTIQF
jgi:hypothetical protein